MTTGARKLIIDLEQRDAGVDIITSRLQGRDLRPSELLLANTVVEQLILVGVGFDVLTAFGADDRTWFGLGQAICRNGSLGFGWIEDELVLRVSVGGRNALTGTRLLRMTNSGLMVNAEPQAGREDYDWPGRGWRSLPAQEAKLDIAELLGALW